MKWGKKLQYSLNSPNDESDDKYQLIKYIIAVKMCFFKCGVCFYSFSKVDA